MVWIPRTRWGRGCLYVGLTAVAYLLDTWVRSTFGQDGTFGVLFLAQNTFATPTNVMREVAQVLVNNTVFAHRDNCIRTLDDQFRLRGVKQGDTIQVRLPQRYQVTVGKVMSPTPLTDQTVAVTISDQTNVGFEYDSWAYTLEVDDYMERYAKPAVAALVNNIDATGLSRMYLTVAKSVGTPGTPPGASGTLPQSAMQPYIDARTKLREVAVLGPYIAMLSADMHAYAVTGMAELFNPGPLISAHFKEGQFGGQALGIDRWYEDENVARHTVGALGGTPLINGASQTGTSITIDGAGGAVTNYVRNGDVVQFAGCNDTNPQSRNSTGRLKDFVVTANANAAASGAVTLTISPSLIISGEWQTASASPANNAVVTIFGHASSYAALEAAQGLVYNKEAFVLVMADLVLPRGLWVAERVRNSKLGVSVRMLKDTDIINDEHPCRLDTAHGWTAWRQELACRVQGG